MLVGVAIGDGTTVGATLLVGTAICTGCGALRERNVEPTTARQITTAIISTRNDGTGGSGRLVGVVAGGWTSGNAPIACIDASITSWTWSVSSSACSPTI